MKFSKYQAAGNDFLIVFEREIDSVVAKQICDRYYGVGADGIINLKHSTVVDFSFSLFNADGSLAEVSGNGLRCVAKYLFERGLHKSDVLKVEAAGDVKILQMTVEGGKVTSTRADMGTATEDSPITLQGLDFKRINVGNPHAATFVDDITKAPVTEIGPLVENDPMFPNRTNVEFVQQDGEVLHVRFWERGVGVTNSSGTGSCSAFVASGLRKATVKTLGGDLYLERGDNGHIFLTGDAEHVFDGDWN